jgi:hypothetical protein
MSNRDGRLTVRLTPVELSLLRSISEVRHESQAECARAAIRIGLPFVRGGHKLDLYRLIANIEYLQAAVETMISRDYDDMADRLLDVAVERVEKFHA